MIRVTTKGTSCLLLTKSRFLHYITETLTSFLIYDTKFVKFGSDTFENASFTKCEFIFIFFIFYTLFCSLSHNKHGRPTWCPFYLTGYNSLPLWLFVYVMWIYENQSHFLVTVLFQYGKWTCVISNELKSFPVLKIVTRVMTRYNSDSNALLHNDRPALCSDIVTCFNHCTMRSCHNLWCVDMSELNTYIIDVTA